MKKTNESVGHNQRSPVAVAITELAKSAVEKMANNKSETLYEHLKVGKVRMVIQKLEEFATTVVLRAAKGQDRARAPHTIL